MGIMNKAENKAEDIHQKQAVEARSRYYLYVMEQEGCTLEEAVNLCTGQTEPPVAEYMLGWKLADPFVQLGLFHSGKKVRERYIRHLEKDMTPEELKLFREDVLTQDNVARFKAALDAKSEEHEKKKAERKAERERKKAERKARK